jgi:hypothetical protein
MKMKKQILISLIIINSGLTMNAQWNGTNPLWTNSNIAIGTDNPQANLHIKYTTNSAFLRLESSATNQNASTQYVSGGVWRWELGTGISSGTNFELYDRVNNKACFVAKPDGFIGVGTDNPQANLHIKYSTNSAFLRLESSATNQNASTQYVSDGVWRWELGTGISSGTNFELYDRINNKACFVAKPDGFIGIGTTNPQYKLDVEGTIRAKEIKVCLQSGCDFVFNKDYKLMNLNDLEKFVTTKQHLPEIASEKDMIENGLNMKEFQMKLLQKMEEMTLYIIEQNKKNEKQEQKIKILETKIKKLESNKR